MTWEVSVIFAIINLSFGVAFYRLSHRIRQLEAPWRIVADQLGERLERVEDLVGDDGPFALKRRKSKAPPEPVENTQ